MRRWYRWQLLPALVTLACGSAGNDNRPLGDVGPGDLLGGDASPSDSWTGDPLVGDPFAGDSVAGDNISGGDLAGTPCSANPQTVVILVAVADLQAAIDAGTTLAVVDVREPTETANGIIDGALLYPWNSGALQANHASLPTNRPLHVICASGGRSGQAALYLINNSHTCVYSISGGMTAWVGAGYPTVQP